MEIIEVTDDNLSQAGRIHSESWKESHRSFCTAEFVEKHSPDAQTEYLRREMAAGKRLWMLMDESPVGLVSVQGSLIENLYILPEQQGKGFGTKLLHFAMEQCEGTPTLWILNNNEGAQRLYERNGFHLSGRRLKLTESLYEMEMEYEVR